MASTKQLATFRVARLDGKGVADRRNRVSTTSLAVVYAVPVETGLDQTRIGKLIMMVVR